MPNLTECKDCGHVVSKRAKTCPNCGVDKPGVVPAKPGCGTYILLTLSFAAIAMIFINQADLNKGDSENKTQYVTPKETGTAPPASKLRVYTDGQIQEAIAQSDDYEIYRAEFTEAATSLLTSRRCGRYEMTQYGGFVKSTTTYKGQPVYFTYCGGNTIANRIYLDVSTGRIFK